MPKIVLRKEFEKHNDLKKKDNKKFKKEKKITKRLIKLRDQDPGSELAEKFTHTRLDNVLLNDDFAYHVFRGRLRKRKFGAGDNSSVLINAGHKMLYKIPFKIYKELSKIKYMTIQLDVRVYEDGHDEEPDEESFGYLSKQYEISSMNQLFNYIAIRAGMRESLNIYGTGVGWFSTVVMVEMVNVLYKDETSERMEFSKFVHKFDLIRYGEV